MPLGFTLSTSTERRGTIKRSEPLTLPVPILFPSVVLRQGQAGAEGEDKGKGALPILDQFVNFSSTKAP